MSDLGIFIFGIAIFAIYMFGLLSMINKQHKIQAKQWPKEKNEDTGTDALKAAE